MKFNPAKAAKLFLAYRERKEQLFPGEGDSASPPTLDDALRETLQLGVVQVLEGRRDRYGRQLLYMQMDRIDYSKDCCTPDKFARMFWFLCDRMLCLSEETQKKGIVLLHNLSGCGRAQFNRKTPKLLLENIQGRLPVRVGAVIINHQPWFFNVMFTIVSMFMKEKIKKRIIVVGTNQSELQKFIDPANIPKELDGLFTLDYSAWVASIDSPRPTFFAPVAEVEVAKAAKQKKKTAVV